MYIQQNTTFAIRSDSCRLHYIDHNSNFPFHAKHASTHHGIDPIISQYSSFVSIYSIKQMVQFCQLKRDERIEWQSQAEKKVFVYINLWSAKQNGFSVTLAL